jgi:hypothetical protein
MVPGYDDWCVANAIFRQIEARVLPRLSSPEHELLFIQCRANGGFVFEDAPYGLTPAAQQQIADALDVAAAELVAEATSNRDESLAEHLKILRRMLRDVLNERSDTDRRT